MKKILQVLGIAAALASPLAAQSPSLETLASQASLDQRIADLSERGDAHVFERGMLQSLKAVETTLQLQYRYGFQQRFMRSVPVLRTGLDNLNPNPETPTPETLSEIVRTLVRDLERARQTLAAAPPQPFALTLQDLWFDINANGMRDEGEGVVQLVGPVALGGRNWRALAESERLKTPLVVRFDVADHAWLTAYTHMLSGFGQAFLAFDPTEVIARVQDARATLQDIPEIDNIFAGPALEAQIADLQKRLQDARAAEQRTMDQSKTLRAQVNDLRNKLRSASDDEKSGLEAELAALNAELQVINRQKSEARRNRRDIAAEIESALLKQHPDSAIRRPRVVEDETLDSVLILIKSLEQEPKADHVTAWRDHWHAMIAENRKFWTLLDAETDNDREWIQNARQTSALGIDFPDGTPQAWQSILADAEAVLNGNLLVPHPFLPPGSGINMAAWFDHPSSLDLASWLHGFGAFPYTAKGPVLSNQSWRAFVRLTGSQAGGFALFFN